MQNLLNIQLTVLQELLELCHKHPIDSYLSGSKERVPLSIIKEEQEVITHVSNFITANTGLQLSPESLITLMSMINQSTDIQIRDANTRPIKEQILNTMLAMLNNTNARAQRGDRAA